MAGARARGGGRGDGSVEAFVRGRGRGAGLVEALQYIVKAPMAHKAFTEL